MPPISKKNNKKFIVLGAGINGLTCAFRLSEQYPGIAIEIIGESFSPNTTSDLAAGLWEPYLLGDTPKENVRKWSELTYKYFHSLWRGGLANECGVSLVPYVFLSSEGYDPEEFFWRDVVFSFHELPEQRLRELGQEHGAIYKSGVEFITFTCEPSRLMKFYSDRLKSRGAIFRRQKIDCLQAVYSREASVIVINCLGLGSGEILKDPDVEPIRGQIRRVEAPWMFHAFTHDSAYVIPNTGGVTLGGTSQKGDRELNTRDCDKEAITEGCYKFARALERAPLGGDLVGLRPARRAVRLELEWIETDQRHLLPMIHNYGHGGSGITLAWGCATDVLELVQQNILKCSTAKSKL